ncbi:hypothetical protein B0H13DRAFT_2412212 [Mycena leptocephala]|nr:hypothetical protein B0H13DRAFT_2412212 [Mycena leptocephala]
MACNVYVLNKTWDDRVVEDIIVIWDRWEPACDSCGCLESSLGGKLFCCSYCRVARYCSPKCQKYDWMDGSLHKDRCHLFEVDRKLSDEIKSTESFGSRFAYISFPLSAAERWYPPGSTIYSEHRGEIVSVRQHHKNFGMIQAAVFQNRNGLEHTPNLGIFIKLVGRALTMIIVPSTLSVLWTALPPGFDLHRYITHVNRGITHFHGSFWPLPRRLSDSAFEAAEPPPEWLRYMLCHSAGFQYDTTLPESNTGVMMVFAVVKRDGTTLLYKYDNDISSAFYSDAIAKVDPTEFKKLLDDPSRKLCMIPAYKCRLTFPVVSLTSL